jgi:hypothetical protein
MTKVKFLIEDAYLDIPKSVYAFFPEMPYSSTDKNLFTCYAHVGQHGCAHINYLTNATEANFNEYNGLLKELIGQGYKDLVIMNSQQITAHREPTKGEIKFGEGATHYRDFTMAEIGITKTGDIKQWFKADDGLRYYTR